MLGKLKQRPTMASFPPWAASEQGLPGRPLGPCYFLCWLRGSWPASKGRKQAASPRRRAGAQGPGAALGRPACQARTACSAPGRPGLPGLPGGET